VAALPAELLAFDTSRGGDENRAGLVEQPVRLRLAQPIRPRRVEAIEHALVVEEAKSILGSAFRAEEEQRQLVGRQQLVLVERERDRAVAFGQVTSQLEDALGAHAHGARARSATAFRIRQWSRPSLSGSLRAREPARVADSRRLRRSVARRRKRWPTRRRNRRRKRSRRQLLSASLGVANDRAVASASTRSREQQIRKERDRFVALFVAQRLQLSGLQHHAGVAGSAVACSSKSFVQRHSLKSITAPSPAPTHRSWSNALSRGLSEHHGGFPVEDHPQRKVL
jgi:hypothetical protein